MIPTHGQTTGQEIFCQLCDSRVDAGLRWKNIAGITIHRAPSMTGRRNALVALVQRKLEEEGGIATYCIIHQQALCSKCLKFDNVMSDIVKCINHIRSRGLKHWQFHAFLGEIESAYDNELYFTQVRWLSRRKVLKRVFGIRAEVKAFVEKDAVTFPVLSVDITQELNVLDKK